MAKFRIMALPVFSFFPIADVDYSMLPWLFQFLSLPTLSELLYVSLGFTLHL